MRPKRRILLMDANEDRHGEIAYFLRVKGFDVPDTMECGAELILAMFPDGEREMQAMLAAKFCDCSFLLIKAELSKAELFERVWIASCRKRGPKKGSKRLAGRPAGERG